MNYQKINNITGWAVFAIATIVYWITIEETASFWDCGEFIAVSYKLMVPHPPGAPFFLLLGRMFSFLALGDVTRVAYWINMLSVLASSFTILFLFWSIVLLGRKLLKIKPGDVVTRPQTLMLMASGIIGALAYTFSDSFWFSAVEAEVYAMSSFFTAFVFWAILKWELVEDEASSNRWLILIAYMMGLSIGVHLLNLVTIPALGMIYYFKKHKVTLTGLVACFGISGFILILINNIVIPGLPSIAGSFELWFVNGLGLPFGSGALVFGLLFLGAVVAGIIYTHKKAYPILNTAILGFAFVLIGYSSYSLILIRSNFNPPIDENNPEDVMSFVKYLKREQYGSRPLFHGQYFDAQIKEQNEGAVRYIKGEEKYEEGDRTIINTYDPKRSTILPRMYSSQPQHIKKYREVTGLAEGEKPKFSHNIWFLFKHQIGFMWYRYFMWNFAGRESDIQGAGWLSPMEAMQEVPTSVAENKGRNNFFMLPLLLGLIGAFFQYSRAPKSFAVVAMLFFLTGIALILYLNSPPIEPRERDYIYVGSYYAFAIWIGFGVLALADAFAKKIKNAVNATALAFALSLSAPLLMAAEGWDDHNRSSRFFSVDSAKNFLASCAPNAIIFTGGDNDTFPLWYVQDVEGFRTDVRVVVLSYFNTDWYVDQMTMQAYESAPFPFTLTKSNYQQGGPNDILPFYELVKKPINLKQFINLVKNEDKRLRGPYKNYNVVPSKEMFLNINKEDVIAKGIIPKGMEDQVVDRMAWKLKGNSIEKKDLMILDILATNNWERPIYFNNTSRSQIKIGLENYMVQEGNAYRLLPISKPSGTQQFVNTDIMYDNVMNKFHFRELDNENVYYNEDYRNFVMNHRTTFNTLAKALIDEGKNEKAKEVIDASLSKMPDKAVPYDYTISETVSLLFQLEQKERAVEIAVLIGDRADEALTYYVDNNIYTGYEVLRMINTLRLLQGHLQRYGESELAKKYRDVLTKHYEDIQQYERSLFGR